MFAQSPWDLATRGPRGQPPRRPHRGARRSRLPQTLNVHFLEVPACGDSDLRVSGFNSNHRPASRCRSGWRGAHQGDASTAKRGGRRPHVRTRPGHGDLSEPFPRPLPAGIPIRLSSFLHNHLVLVTEHSGASSARSGSAATTPGPVRPEVRRAPSSEPTRGLSPSRAELWACFQSIHLPHYHRALHHSRRTCGRRSEGTGYSEVNIADAQRVKGPRCARTLDHGFRFDPASGV